MPENKCPACQMADEKTTHRSDGEKKKLINRLNRIEGQIRGIRILHGYSDSVSRRQCRRQCIQQRIDQPPYAYLRGARYP